MTVTDTETEVDDLKAAWDALDPDVRMTVLRALPLEYGSKKLEDYSDDERALFWAIHAAVLRGVEGAGGGTAKAAEEVDADGLEPYPETLDPAPLYHRIMMLRPEAQGILHQRWAERGLPALDAPLAYDVYQAAEAMVASVEPEAVDPVDFRMAAMDLPPAQRSAFGFRCRNEIGNAGPMEMTSGRVWQAERIWDEVTSVVEPVAEASAPILAVSAPSADDLRTIASALAWVHGDPLRAGVLLLHEMRRSAPRQRLLVKLREIVAAEPSDDAPKPTPKQVEEVAAEVAPALAEAQAEVDHSEAIAQLEEAAAMFSKAVGEVRSALRKLKEVSS